MPLGTAMAIGSALAVGNVVAAATSNEQITPLVFTSQLRSVERSVDPGNLEELCAFDKRSIMN